MLAHYQQVRARLMCPPNAVYDHGIDLRRKIAPIAVLPVRAEYEMPTPWWPTFDGMNTLRYEWTDVEPVLIDRILIRHVMQATCRHYRITKVDLLARRRNHKTVRPRQIAMYLCHVLTGASYPEIGRQFGGYDHTTALSAVRRVKKRIHDVTDYRTAQDIEAIKLDLGR